MVATGVAAGGAAGAAAQPVECGGAAGCDGSAGAGSRAAGFAGTSFAAPIAMASVTTNAITIDSFGSCQRLFRASGRRRGQTRVSS